jgi:hypothetical protein
MTPSHRYLAERSRIDHIRAAVVQALSGRDMPVLWDGDPTSTYCVGVLTSSEEDSLDDGRATERRRRRKPIALGFSARIEPELSDVVGHLRLSLALYYRQVPTLVEQRAAPEETQAPQGEDNEEESLPGVGQGDPDARISLRIKYHRVEVDLPTVTFRTTCPADGRVVELDFAVANALLNERLQQVRSEIAADPRCWEGSTNYRVPRSALADETSYEEARRVAEPDLPIWRVILSGQLSNTGDGWRLSVLAENQSSGGGSQHPLELFDVRCRAILQNAQFVSRPFEAATKDYRYQTESWGRGVNAVLEVDPDDPHQAWTETLPLFEQPRTRTRHETVSNVQALAADPLGTLNRIALLLDKYATEWATYNEEWRDTPTYEERLKDLETFRREIQRFRFGIEVLSRDNRLLRGFQLANEAAAARPSRPLQSWRLFQLVFIVSQAPSLLAREQRDDEQLRRELEMIDVLWYPTGGGKTEAYFGAILMAMFYDRLRGKLRGTTAWLRYPLRMLSIQQLQRLTDFVVAAEQVRQANRLGGDRFTVGYYVGSSNMPNELTRYKARTQPIEVLLKEANKNEGDVASLHVLQRCPYCGAPQPRVEVDATPSVLRLRHRCAACKREAPIYLSDSEIYRYLPTVLVGTVDRLARAGQTDQFSHLFAQVDARCPQHGYFSFDQCVEGPVCKVKQVEQSPVDETYDPTPALLLQDELHLLKESLGTYDAHYEGFLDTAAACFGTGLPSKRLAATATIEGYEEHVRELYSRKARRFPAKGREEWDSAYAEHDTENPIARLYLGILPFGMDSDVVAKRIAKVVAEEAATYWTDPSRDKQLADLYDLALIYVNKKSAAGNIGARLKDEYQDERAVLSLTGDRSLDEVRAAIDRVEGDVALPYEQRLHTLLATSLISHGVDLDRLNVMAFVGYPGRAADYIQSSSRVGRSHVGLICTVFDPASTLDRSVYAHFHEYHERLYQLVQPVPINRFSEASIKRTLTGIYSALLLNVVAMLKRQAGEWKESLYPAAVMQRALARGVVSEEEMIDLLLQSYALNEYGLPTEVEVLLRKTISQGVRKAQQDIELEEEWATYQRLRPVPISSLREVEEQVKFYPARKAQRQIKLVRGY